MVAKSFGRKTIGNDTKMDGDLKAIPEDATMKATGGNTAGLNFITSS